MSTVGNHRQIGRLMHNMKDFFRYSEKYNSCSVVTRERVKGSAGSEILEPVLLGEDKQKIPTSTCYNRTGVPVKGEVLNIVKVDVLRRKMDIYRNKQAAVNKRHCKSAAEIKQRANKEYVAPICPFCSRKTIIKTAKEHTGKEAAYCYWVCPSCPNISVTTRKGTYFPSGNLADAKTRRMRGEVQRLLKDKKEELNYDRFALNEWVGRTLNVYPEQAWVGRLDKEQLVNLAKATQREIYLKSYEHIFRVEE